MKNFTSLASLIYIFILIAISKCNKNNFLEINPSDESSISQKDGYNKRFNLLEDLNKADDISDMTLLFTVTTTGYLSISTLKPVIVYPFSEKPLKINVFYDDKTLLIKDQNDIALWKFKFDPKEKYEFLTFINRGTLLARDASEERIWPFTAEELNKKLYLNYLNGVFELTDKDNQIIWAQPLFKAMTFQEDKVPLKDEENKGEIPFEDFDYIRSIEAINKYMDYGLSGSQDDQDNVEHYKFLRKKITESEDAIEKDFTFIETLADNQAPKRKKGNLFENQDNKYLRYFKRRDKLINLGGLKKLIFNTKEKEFLKAINIHREVTNETNTDRTVKLNKELASTERKLTNRTASKGPRKPNMNEQEDRNNNNFSLLNLNKNDLTINEHRSNLKHNVSPLFLTKIKSKFPSNSNPSQLNFSSNKDSFTKEYYNNNHSKHSKQSNNSLLKVNDMKNNKNDNSSISNYYDDHFNKEPQKDSFRKIHKMVNHLANQHDKLTKENLKENNSISNINKSTGVNASNEMINDNIIEKSTDRIPSRMFDKISMSNSKLKQNVLPTNFASLSRQISKNELGDLNFSNIDYINKSNKKSRRDSIKSIVPSVLINPAVDIINASLLDKKTSNNPHISFSIGKSKVQSRNDFFLNFEKFNKQKNILNPFNAESQRNSFASEKTNELKLPKIMPKHIKHKSHFDIIDSISKNLRKEIILNSNMVSNSQSFLINHNDKLEHKAYVADEKADISINDNNANEIDGNSFLPGIGKKIRLKKLKPRLNLIKLDKPKYINSRQSPKSRAFVDNFINQCKSHQTEVKGVMNEISVNIVNTNDYYKNDTINLVRNIIGYGINQAIDKDLYLLDNAQANSNKKQERAIILKGEPIKGSNKYLFENKNSPIIIGEMINKLDENFAIQCKDVINSRFIILNSEQKILKKNMEDKEQQKKNEIKHNEKHKKIANKCFEMDKTKMKALRENKKQEDC